MKTYRIVKQPQWVLIEDGEWSHEEGQVVGQFELRRDAKAAMAPLVEAAESKEAYASLADELNDSPESYDPTIYEDGVLGADGKPTLAYFDAETVRLGEIYARKNGLNWPPQTGDYDRLWERENYRS